MKTTIELPDDLLERSKVVARRENSTLKALIEEGLRLALRALQALPNLAFIAETDEHLPRLHELASAGKAQGGAIHDARIAAICLAHGVTELWTADRDFSRYPALNTRNPLID